MNLTPDQAKTIAEFLLPQFEAESKTTERVIASVPDDRSDYRPSDKCMSARKLAIHLAAAENWFLEGVINGAFGTPDASALEGKPAAELASWYRSSLEQNLKKLAGLSGEQLLRPVSFFGSDWTGLNLLGLALKHSVHHRGQMSSYLRPMGAKVPAIYGGSADTEEQSKAAQG